MALIASDSITAANGTPLQNLSGWARVSFYADPAYASVQSNRVAGQGYNVNYYRTEIPSSADQSVQADIYAIDYGTETGKYCFVGARMDSAVNTGYLGGRSDGTWVIQRRVNNGTTVLATSSADYYHLASKTARLEVTGAGATVDLKLYVNNVLTLTASDSAAERITSVGRVGIRVTDSNNLIDNFYAETIESSGTNATLVGSTLTATTSITAGSITGIRNKTLSGATLTATSSITAGSITGGSTINDTLSGATLTATSSITAGTISGTSSGSFSTAPMENNTGAGVLASTAVVWTWVQGEIGTAPTSLTHGSGTTNASGVLTATGLPTGTGYLLAATTDRSSVYYQTGTIA